MEPGCPSIGMMGNISVEKNKMWVVGTEIHTGNKHLIVATSREHKKLLSCLPSVADSISACWSNGIM